MNQNVGVLHAVQHIIGKPYVFKLRNQMKSRCVARHLDVVSEVFPLKPFEGIPSLDKAREDQLFQRGRMQITKPFERSALLDQRTGEDQIADSQGRREDFTECSNIKHNVRIQALQRTDGRAFVAEFAVIVVLHNVFSALSGIFNQLQPSYAIAGRYVAPSGALCDRTPGCFPHCSGNRGIFVDRERQGLSIRVERDA